uniref:Helicase-associated domain-containing protein n=1 Tax=Odontella aurita TaxID=265563 RepID=A0A7S4JSE0_9STRA
MSRAQQQQEQAHAQAQAYAGLQYGRHRGDSNFVQAVAGAGNSFPRTGLTYGVGMHPAMVQSASFQDYGNRYVSTQQLPPQMMENNRALAAGVKFEDAAESTFRPLPQDHRPLASGIGNSAIPLMLKRELSPIGGWASDEDVNAARKEQEAAVGVGAAREMRLMEPPPGAKVPPFASAAGVGVKDGAYAHSQVQQQQPSSAHPAEKWSRQHCPKDDLLPLDGCDDPEAMKQLSPSDRTWIHRFQDLKAFQAAHGHCNVPRVFPANPSLASWVHNQRKDYKRLRTNRKSAMTEMRVQCLTNMGFEWNQQGANWDRRLEELKDFKALHRHTNVPQRYGGNAALGRWVNTQRLQQRLRKQGQNSDMTDDRFKRLSELGFVWYVKGPDQWMDRYKELEAFNDEFGNCDVPSRYAPNRRLGRWVSFQRTQYRLKLQSQHNHLTDERMKRLEKLGFSWTAPGQNPETDHGGTAEASLVKREHVGDKRPPLNKAAKSAGAGNFTSAAGAARSGSLPGSLETSTSTLDASELMKMSDSTLEISPAEPKGTLAASAAELLKTAELESPASSEDERMADIQEEPFSSSPSGDGGSSQSPSERKGPTRKRPHVESKDGKRFGDGGGRNVRLPGSGNENYSRVGLNGWSV